MATEFTATSTTLIASSNVMRKSLVVANNAGPGTVFILCQEDEPEDPPSADLHDYFVPASQLLTISGQDYTGNVWAAFSEADSVAMIKIHG